MKLAIIGSREFQDRPLMIETLTDWIRENGKPTHIVSGGAQGADRMAASIAEDLGIPVIEHLPDYKTHGGKQAPLERNKLIVADCDEMLAFPLASSRGSWHAIKFAQKQGKPVKIVES